MKRVYHCPKCDITWEFEDYEVILIPWPHFECPHCGHMFPAF